MALGLLDHGSGDNVPQPRECRSDPIYVQLGQSETGGVYGRSREQAGDAMGPALIGSSSRLICGVAAGRQAREDKISEANAVINAQDANMPIG